MIKKRWTPSNRERLKEQAIDKAKKQMKERDENFKENWQRWNDEHHDD